MDQQPENPFASPATSQAENPQSRIYHDLIPLWIWLGLTSSLPIFLKLSDPISNVLLLLANLIPLWVGWGLATIKSRMLQAILLLIFMATTVWLSQHFTAIKAVGPVFVFINVVLAAFAAWRLGERRLKVMTYFSIGFVLGTPLICYGTVIGGIVASLLAVRNTKPPPEITDDAQAQPPR